MKKIYLEDLLKASPKGLGLEPVTLGKGRKKPLLPEVQKVGLALTGHLDSIDTRKIQVFGKTEVSYLQKLSARKRRELAGGLFKRKAPLYLVSGRVAVPDEVLDEAEKAGVPLVSCPLETLKCIKEVIKVIEELSAKESHFHGVLVDVMGVGVLLIGPSGIGKSECAIELVVRGHRLVADDIVVIRKHSDGRLIGSGAEMLRYLVEVRGIGIVNVKDLFGISSIKSKKTIDMVVELVKWDEEESYDRLGLDEHTYNVAGVDLPYVKMPVTPGRNIAVIVEVAARNHALKLQGHNAAAALDRRLAGRLAGGAEA